MNAYCKILQFSLHLKVAVLTFGKFATF